MAQADAIADPQVIATINRVDSPVEHLDAPEFLAYRVLPANLHELKPQLR